MNFENFDRKQNLFLFFEENEDENVINSRLVSLYMNRMVIDETYQNEIVGIFQQKKVSPETFKYRSAKEINPNDERKQFIQQVLAQKNLDCVFKHEFLFHNRENTAQFIIASDFPMFYSVNGEKPHWIEKWFQSKLETLVSQSVSVAVTILSGSKGGITSSSLLNQFYLPLRKRNRLFDFLHRFYSEYNTVIDDLETRESEMHQMGKDFDSILSRATDKKSSYRTRYGRIHIDPILDSSAKVFFQHKSLWLHQMLNDSEIEKEWKVKKVSPIGPIYVQDYSENPITTRFFQICDCQRLTMFFIPAGDTV